MRCPIVSSHRTLSNGGQARERFRTDVRQGPAKNKTAKDRVSHRDARSKPRVRGQRSMQIRLLNTSAEYSYSSGQCKRIESPGSRFSLTLSTSSSTVKVLDVRTVPRVVKHRIAGFRLLAKANAALALSATRATCSGFSAALDAGGQSLASAPRAKPSSSFSTATKSIISAR